MSNMEKALTKGSVSAIAKAYIDENPQGVTAEQVHKFIFDKGLDKDYRQVYTTLQTMASTGRLNRGAKGSGLFFPANSVVPEKVVVEKAIKEKQIAKKKPSERVVKAQVPVYSNEDVFTYLIEQLGEPREYTATTIGHSYVLLGEAPAQYLIDRYRLATGKDPIAWTVNKLGPNVHVVFLDA